MNTEPRMNISDKIKEICPVEIYVDYRDFDFLEETVVACKTQQEFEEKLEESYLDSFHYEIDEIESYLLSEGYSVEEIEEHRDEIVVYLDTNQFLNKNIQVSILTDFYNDANYDFTLNDGWCRWLVRSQGYKYSDANIRYYLDRSWNLKNETELKKHNNKFLSSVENEIFNMPPGYRRTLVFLVNMTIRDYFALKEGRKKSITISKDTVCGLFNPWSGSGSTLDIKLEKDVKINQKNIFDLIVEFVSKKNRYTYGVNDVYGLCESVWSEGKYSLK